MPPKLSICLPTYNRAQLLESALYALLPQVRAAGELVELIVSDNCSSDDTQGVAMRARVYGPLSYHRNETNLGPVGNIHVLCNELATGDFVWIVCDDDLMLPGGLDRVLSVLKGHPEVDYVFVNTSIRSSDERNRYKHLTASHSISELLPTKARDLTERPVERWEELLDPAVDEVFLGSIMCSVFRLSRWRQHTLKPGHALFDSLDTTYPHAVTLAHTMIGRKAYYLGYPCTMAFFGEQEWLGYLPLILLVRLQELLDLYLKLGVDSKQIQKCRESLLDISTGALKEMLLNLDTLGSEYFSLPRFVWRNRFNSWKLCRTLCYVYLSGKLPRPIYDALARYRKHTIRLLGRRVEH
jgi:glycosyltransferase involved in cell wall biosynthesis